MEKVKGGALMFVVLVNFAFAVAAGSALAYLVLQSDEFAAEAYLRVLELDYRVQDLEARHSRDRGELDS